MDEGRKNSARYRLFCPPQLKVIGNTELCEDGPNEGVILYVRPFCGAEGIPGERFDSIIWYRDNQLLKGENDSTLRVTQSGKYSAVTIAFVGDGRDYVERIDTNILFLSAKAPPKDDWMVALPQVKEYCKGRDNRIGIEPLENIMYFWRKDGILLPDQHSNEMFVAEDGAYEIGIRNACGEAPGTKLFPILLKDTPPLPEIEELELPCGPGMAQITLSNEVTGAVRWYDHDQRFLTEAYGLGLEIYEAVRIYVDQVIDGCNSDMKAIDLSVLEGYPVKVGDFTISADSELRIEPSDVPETGTFRWLPDDGQLEGTDTRTPVFSPGNKACYQYVLEYTSPNGCITKDTTNIHIISGYKIPDIITPNGDGQNDVWVIEGLQVFPDNEVVIYDRRGQEVYRAKPYRNDWNGISGKGDVLPSGSYVYKISGLADTPVCGMVSVIRK